MHTTSIDEFILHVKSLGVHTSCSSSSESRCLLAHRVPFDSYVIAMGFVTSVTLYFMDLLVLEVSSYVLVYA